MKILYLDTETTGLDPIKHDIVQVAGIIEINGEVKEEFEFKVQPSTYASIDEAALRVHGFSLEQIKGFEPPRTVHQKLTEIFGKYVSKFNPSDKFTPAGHNAKFDVDFMRQFFLKCGDQYFGSWCNYRTIDLLAVMSFLSYAEAVSLENQKLETIAKYFGVEFKAHDALEDIRATREILKRLVAGLFKPVILNLGPGQPGRSV
jgi:DNA polymerase-3 subunit epsilon